MLYEFDFENFFLPKYEYRLLKRASRHKHIKYNPCLDNLVQTGLITFVNWSTNSIGEGIPIKTECKITTKGLAYIQYRKNHFTDVRLPIIISALALIASIVAILISKKII